MKMCNDNEIFKAYKTDILTPIGPYCDKIYDDYDGLQIFLREGQDKFPVYKVVFKAPLSYRSTNDKYRLGTVTTDPQDILSGIYIVENSKYMRWFHEESLKIYEIYDVKHYCICSQDDWIDVLSRKKPDIYIL